jgi:NitT/TauT family transport system substrate-binding protein
MLRTGVWLGAALAAAWVTLSGQSLTRVRVAYDGFTMSAAPLDFAARQGLFRRFGLDVTPTFIEGGSTLTQATVGGSVDIAQNGYTPAVHAAVQGADLVFIGAINNRLTFQLVVRSDVTTAAHLRGRTVAISRYGSSSDVALDFALRHLGLTRKDVKVLPLGGTTNRIAALVSGGVDASLEQQPETAELSRTGFRTLVDVAEVAGNYPNTSFVTSRAFLRGHRDVTKQFLMSMATAVADYRRHPDVAVPHVISFLGTKDLANARAAYDYYVNVYPPDLRPSLQGITLVLQEIGRTEPKAASFTAARLVDTSLLDALASEGFFARIR